MFDSSPSSSELHRSAGISSVPFLSSDGGTGSLSGTMTMAKKTFFFEVSGAPVRSRRGAHGSVGAGRRFDLAALGGREKH